MVRVRVGMGMVYCVRREEDTRQPKGTAITASCALQCNPPRTTTLYNEGPLSFYDVTFFSFLLKQDCLDCNEECKELRLSVKAASFILFFLSKTTFCRYPWWSLERGSTGVVFLSSQYWLRTVFGDSTEALHYSWGGKGSDLILSQATLWLWTL